MLSIDGLQGGCYIMQDRSKPWTNDRLLLSGRRETKETGKHPGPKQLQQLLSILKRQVSEVSRMKTLVILPLLLCAVACTVQVRAEVKTVKLCGREFLRAVVYTCGGSRWRRLLTETDGDGETTSFYSSRVQWLVLWFRFCMCLQKSLFILNVIHATGLVILLIFSIYLVQFFFYFRLRSLRE